MSLILTWSYTKVRQKLHLLWVTKQYKKINLKHAHKHTCRNFLKLWTSGFLYSIKSCAPHTPLQWRLQLRRSTLLYCFMYWTYLIIPCTDTENQDSYKSVFLFIQAFHLCIFQLRKPCFGPFIRSACSNYFKWYDLLYHSSSLTPLCVCTSCLTLFDQGTGRIKSVSERFTYVRRKSQIKCMRNNNANLLLRKWCNSRWTLRLHLISRTQNLSRNLRWARQAVHKTVFIYLKSVNDLLYHRYGCAKKVHNFAPN